MHACSMMIPSDVINQILCSLPSKSIGRFRCVSKGWQSLLTQPEFIKTHQKTLNRNHHIFERLETQDNITHYVVLYSHPFHQDDDPYIKPTTKLPIELPVYSVTFRGSCDGLVLVSYENDYMDLSDCISRFDTLVLLNPTTKESMTLPQFVGYYPHPRNQESLRINSTHGVGYDSVTDDYKVITLTYFDYCLPDDDGCQVVTRITTRLAIYSLRSNTWRQKIIDSPFDCRLSSPAVYFNGYLHWVGRKKDTKMDTEYLIVAFSLVDECFSEVPSPNLCNDTKIMSTYNSRLVVICGKLAIYKHFAVWLMNGYGVKESWTKIPLGKLGYELRLGNSVIFDDNGKIRVASEGQKMLIYDFEKGTFSKDVYFWSWRFGLFGSYVESLVSLNRKDTTDAKKFLDSSTNRKYVGSKTSEAVLAENLDPICHYFCNKFLRLAKIFNDKKASLRMKGRREGKAKGKYKRNKFKRSKSEWRKLDDLTNYDISHGDSPGNEEGGKDFENLNMVGGTLGNSLDGKPIRKGNVTFQDFLHDINQ